jgi:two-component system, chemotaxis family, response regulator Rcp1
MSNNKDSTHINILLVEDNEGDARLTKEALQRSKIINDLYHVEDGEEAMAFLLNHGKHSKAPRPDLILLDLNLPRKDGREVLADIKADDGLKRIPVIILTTSSDEKDVLTTYDSHANCYITKPLDVKEFFDVVTSIEDFWLSIVKLPNGAKRR